MLPEPREGTGTAEGVALVAPGLAGALEEQREEGLEGVAPSRGKGAPLPLLWGPHSVSGPWDHPWPTLSCSMEHPFPGPRRDVPGGESGFEKDTPERGSGR